MDRRVRGLQIFILIACLSIVAIKNEAQTWQQALALAVAFSGIVLEGPFMVRALKLKKFVYWIPLVVGVIAFICFLKLRFLHL